MKIFLCAHLVLALIYITHHNYITQNVYYKEKLVTQHQALQKQKADLVHCLCALASPHVVAEFASKKGMRPMRLHQIRRVAHEGV